MRILVTGAAGQLGREVLRTAAAREAEALGLVRGEGFPGFACVQADLTDACALRQVMEDLRPDAVINCAAWTAVDAAEAPDNRDAVWAVNSAAVWTLAMLCRAQDARLIQVSTDYVFGRTDDVPILPEDRPAPLSEYGKSKLEGERAAALCENSAVVRTSWLFGEGKNFVRTMLHLGRTHECLRVVSDQTGRPAYAPDLAALLVEAAGAPVRGVLHAANEGPFVSRAAFAQEIMRQAGLKTRIIPVTTAEYGPAAAGRPANSRLSTDCLGQAGLSRLPDWRDALSRYLAWEKDNG